MIKTQHKIELKECDCSPNAYWMYLGNVKIGLKNYTEMSKYECSMCHKLRYLKVKE